MRMLTKIMGISLFIIALVLLAFYQPTVKPWDILLHENRINTKDVEKRNFEKTIEITQKKMQLNHEVIQYKMTFHEDDAINVSVHMLLRQMNVQNKVFFLMLTDGNRSILPQHIDMLYLAYVPMVPIDITTRNNRFTLGQQLIIMLLQKVRFGLEKTLTTDVDVKKNTTWYLTIAVLTPAEGDITVKFSSQHQSMELQQIERHRNLELFSAYDNDFSGTYLGVKLFVFGFGLAQNLNKKIQTTKGSIIHFLSGGHIKGEITVQDPHGKITTDNARLIARYTYLGNQTGAWSFTAKGVSFRWKYGITLFFIDIDPRIR